MGSAVFGERVSVGEGSDQGVASDWEDMVSSMLASPPGVELDRNPEFK